LTLTATQAPRSPAKGYQPGQVRARYVRANVKGGDYSWCDLGDGLAALFTEQTGFDTHL